jgi:hypothetical protein
MTTDHHHNVKPLSTTVTISAVAAPEFSTEITLRDWFAVVALGAMSLDQRLPPDADDVRCRYLCSCVADHAYRIADAMLNRRVR